MLERPAGRSKGPSAREAVVNHTVYNNARRRLINMLETRLPPRAYCTICWYRVAPDITGFCSTNKSRSPTRLQRPHIVQHNSSTTNHEQSQGMRHHTLPARNCPSWAELTVYTTPSMRTVAPSAGLQRFPHFRCFGCTITTTAFFSSTYPLGSPLVRGKSFQSFPQPSHNRATPGRFCRREVYGTTEPFWCPLVCPPPTTFFSRSPLVPAGRRVETVHCVVANFNDHQSVRVTLVLERCFWCSGPTQPLAPLPLKPTDT